MNNKIEVGDIVNVYFTSSNALFMVRVIHKPSDVGDSWYLESTETRLNRQEEGQHHAVILFERMDCQHKARG